MARILMVVAPERFRDEELFVPKGIFEREGHDVAVCSMKAGICTGARGGIAEAEYSINDVEEGEFDAVVFVGGPGSRVFFNEDRTTDIARNMNRAGKVVAAICIAPVILANAGLLKGKEAAVFASEIESIRMRGAKYVPEGVVTSGNIVTASSPESAKAFAERICEMLR